MNVKRAERNETVEKLKICIKIKKKSVNIHNFLVHWGCGGSSPTKHRRSHPHFINSSLALNWVPPPQSTTGVIPLSSEYLSIIYRQPQGYVVWHNIGRCAKDPNSIYLDHIHVFWTNFQILQ